MKKGIVFCLLNILSVSFAFAQEMVNTKIKLQQNAHDKIVFEQMNKQDFTHSDWQYEGYDSIYNTKIYSHFDLNHCNSSSFIFKNLMSKKVKKLQVSEANKNVAYLLFPGARWKGLLNRGRQQYGNWDWNSEMYIGGADITPFIVKDLSKGLSIHDFCLDPNNENRLFVALGGVNEYYKSLVMYSNDGGETWKDMSEGMDAKNVKLIYYDKGTNDRIYAISDNGNYIWNVNKTTWEKYNE